MGRGSMKTEYMLEMILLYFQRGYLNIEIVEPLRVDQTAVYRDRKTLDAVLVFQQKPNDSFNASWAQTVIQVWHKLHSVDSTRWLFKT